MSNGRVLGWIFVYLSFFVAAYYPGYDFGRGANLTGLFSNDWPLVSTNILPVIYLVIALCFFRKAHDGNALMSWFNVAAIGGAGIVGFGLGVFLGWTTIK